MNIQTPPLWSQPTPHKKNYPALFLHYRFDLIRTGSKRTGSKRATASTRHRWVKTALVGQNKKTIKGNADHSTLLLFRMMGGGLHGPPDARPPDSHGPSIIWPQPSTPWTIWPLDRPSQTLDNLSPWPDPTPNHEPPKPPELTTTCPVDRRTEKWKHYHSSCDVRGR